ncbi:SURF1 family protein [Ferrimonas pelagia]|uniref:SURF1-like protein n=1 Tax=Ferrimonas pelagia TaxID=1177826 RepID=A0ABP9F5G1_9GAMM
MLATVLLVKLGVWQLERAEFKRDWMAQLEARGEQPLAWPLGTVELAGYRLSVSGHWLPERALLLDNQTLDGQVGYRWLVPIEIEPAQPWLLVDLGFVPAPVRRNELPALPELPPFSHVSGRLYQPGVNRLAAQLLPESGAVTRIQALEWPALSTLWQHEVVPALLWLKQPSELGFARPWRPINLAPEKHQAYALQWFSLAVACVLISLTLAWRGRLHRRDQADNLG